MTNLETKYEALLKEHEDLKKRYTDREECIEAYEFLLDSLCDALEAFKQKIQASIVPLDKETK